MDPARLQLLVALLKLDFQSFLRHCFVTLAPGQAYVDNWHLAHMAYLLEQVSAGDCRRLIINVPPRSLKSITVSVAYAAFRLGRNPGLKIIVVSHTAELARLHARLFRQIVESSWYRAVFPAFQIAKAGDRLTETLTTMNGFRLATSVGASVTGKGADLIMIDDPNRAQDIQSEARRNEVNSYYDLTLYSRLDNKQTGSILIVMQRLHADDLVGHVAEQEDWTIAAIPAIEVADRSYRIGPGESSLFHRKAGELLQPQRDNLEVLDRNRAVMGSMAFEAQYQQNPLPIDGNIIKRAWLRHYNVPPDTFEFIVASWDTATTIEENADYSVGTVWGLKQGAFYLLEVLRGRFEAPDLRRLIVEVELRWQADISIIEKANIGHALVQDLRRTTTIRPLLITPRFDKTSRLVAQSAKFEAGQVVLPLDAPWLGIYLNELLAFPLGRYDDQVDSTSQALAYLTTKLVRLEPKRQVDRHTIRPRPKGRIGKD